MKLFVNASGENELFSYKNSSDNLVNVVLIISLIAFIVHDIMSMLMLFS
jgi:hypothetical protein